jgi:hypothetical protein
VFSVPEHALDAMCLNCARDDAGVDWEWFAPIGEWHPTVDYRDMDKAIAPSVECEPYPAPEVTSRDGMTSAGAGKAVGDLERLAQRFGYAAEVTYARGCFPNGATGRPGTVKDSLAVRMTQGSVRAVAVYVGGSTWSWDTLTVQRPGAWPARFETLAGFLDGAFGPVLEPVKADRPMEGPARRALKDWGPLKP